MNNELWEKIYKERSRCILYPNENFISFFYRNFINNDLKNINILEIGCGWGNNLKFLKQEGYDPIGVDFSQEAIEYLKTQNYNVFCGDIAKINMEKYRSKFDLIYACGVLECNDTVSIQKILLFCNVALKDNGKLYIFSTNNDFYDKTLAPTPITQEIFLNVLKQNNIKFKDIQIDYLTKTFNNQTQTIKSIEIICTK
ncbi:class I SAM-dependent methyltransferase [Campylobacter lari]|uniref:class I SAM-dependent methyltransferase n=1 Tax=Campylobacter lari TaxID=201 RepID=UPI0008BA284F|nr:class I SAM-dependent methyltransferase [Campylobacter lari]EAJ0333495.1 class I SAM-dependent methyltransferase [Campylobacter lari]QKF75845.1 SAM-dependent methyltransferase [Campylobacter lari subsp. lari]QQT71377.1 class I SAM-dependent methyltransferase [Campylobacter lari]SET02106.1 Methyltransferase domain-containing protein [Campylobacter lari subsp. lari]SUX08191.1 methyltransferase domain-containing protein [Campylobacter lari]